VKRWPYIVLTGILILGIACVYLYRQELGLAAPSGQESGEGTNAEQTGSTFTLAGMNWKMVDRTSDGFKVEMPGEVQQIEIPAFDERGPSVPVKMILCNPGTETSYSVAWADDPPVARVNGHAPDRTMDMARDDALARTQTTLINESRTSIAGFPARDFVGRNAGGGILDSRMIFAGQRLYMLIAAFPSASARCDRDVTRFFNSFAVTSSAGIPETVPPAPARTD
jgi:hypothetical protein